MSNYALVVDTNKRPLNPIHSAQARQLLNQGQAAVFRRYPFTLILKAARPETPTSALQLKLDPGSKTTGLAILDGPHILWAAELNHRGLLIKSALESRKAVRRNRRNRKTRYRSPGLANQTKPKGWLAPSLLHRVQTTLTWVNKLRRYAPIATVAQELVKFDTQLMQNPEISGIQYQQGELAGYEVREYLLEKFNRQCAYCNANHVPLQIEHIQPKSKGGSDCISNLTLACHRCNQAKDNQDIKEFLAKKPELLKRVLAMAKQPLKDASAINSTRWRLFTELKSTGLIVSTGTGGRTKFNRTRLGLPKYHWLDAACVGDVDGLYVHTSGPLIITARGQGGRQKAALNKYGYPIRHNPLRPIKGWCSGDIAVNLLTREVGRVNPRSASNSFNFTVSGKKAINVHVNKLRRIHQKDGYQYSQTF